MVVIISFDKISDMNKVTCVFEAGRNQEEGSGTTLRNVIEYGAWALRKVNETEDPARRELIIARMNDRLEKFHQNRLIFKVNSDLPASTLPVYAVEGEMVYPIIDAEVLTGDFGGVISWFDPRLSSHDLGFQLAGPYFKEPGSNPRRIRAATFIASVSGILSSSAKFTWL